MLNFLTLYFLVLVLKTVNISFDALTLEWVDALCIKNTSWSDVFAPASKVCTQVWADLPQ